MKANQSLRSRKGVPMVNQEVSPAGQSVSRPVREGGSVRWTVVCVLGIPGVWLCLLLGVYAYRTVAAVAGAGAALLAFGVLGVAGVALIGLTVVMARREGKGCGR